VSTERIAVHMFMVKVVTRAAGEKGKADGGLKSDMKST